MLLPNVIKMPFFFLYFAVLLVHHYTLTAATALPVNPMSISRKASASVQLTRCQSEGEGVIGGSPGKAVTYTENFEGLIDPVQATVLTGAHGTDIKQMRTLSRLFPANFGNSEHGHLGLSSNHMQEKNSQHSEKKKEFHPCEVSNKTFQHRERIPRTDPCEMCVCVDSEMYCFWKLCTFFNLTTETPSPPTASIRTQETLKQSVSDNNISLGRTNATVIRENKVETTDEKFSKILKDQRKHNALKKLEATSPPKTSDFGNAKTPNVSTSTEKPTICHVMGVTYKYGEILPRDTGTCLECACSEGGRVSCSPKDCVSQPDLDYLSHNNNLDMFELDTF